MKRNSALCFYLLLANGSMLLPGCGGTQAGSQVQQQAQDPETVLKGILASFKQERPTMAVYQNAVKQLNTYLEPKRDIREKFTLSAASRKVAEEDLLRDLLSADRQQRVKDLERGSFTEVDGHHLDACFLFRDAAMALRQGLGLEPGQKLTDADQSRLAQLAFDWIVRQIALRSRIPKLDPWPAHEVLRRGVGSEEDHDRARVFLVLLEQLELDGCMVTRTQAGPGEGREVPWVPALRLGSELYLFETGLGIPIPGPGGQGIATLRQAQTDPAVLKALGRPEAPYAVTPAQVAKAQVLVPSSLPALAPRMSWLQERFVDARNHITLFEDVPATLKRFKEAGVAAEVRPWTSGKQAAWYPAILLPRHVENRLGQPRWDDSPDVVPRYLLPRWLQEAAARMGELYQRQVFQSFDTLFLTVRIEPGGVRDLLVRGRPELAVDRILFFESRLEKAHEAYMEGFRGVEAGLQNDWVPRLDAASRELQDRLARRPAAGSGPAEEDLRPHVQRVMAVWQSQQTALSLLFFEWAAPELREHLTYFMGLAKMDMAVRAELLAERTKSPTTAAEKWADAANAWESAGHWFLRCQVMVLPLARNHWSAAAEGHLVSCHAHAATCRKALARK